MGVVLMSKRELNRIDVRAAVSWQPQVPGASMV